MMTVSEIENKGIWETFLLNCEEKTFLHSWNWGEFQKKMNNRIWRLGIYEDSELISLALVVRLSAKRGIFLFVPHGPVVSIRDGGIKNLILATLLQELTVLAKKEKASFIRISPVWDRNPENIKIFSELKFREAPIHMHAEETWELDITAPEENLLKGMRDTTRYLIRRAPRDGVEIVKSDKVGDLGEFNKVYRETVDRNHFVPFSDKYLKNEFDSFSKDNEVLIFLGKYQGETISSAMIIFWSNIAFYHHGASSFKYAKIPASYLLQWEVMKEAANRGCKTYNFWGVAPDDDPKHPWRGLTLFKTGFGGARRNLVKTQDYPLSKKYWLTYLIETARKSRRRL